MDNKYTRIYSLRKTWNTEISAKKIVCFYSNITPNKYKKQT